MVNVKAGDIVEYRTLLLATAAIARKKNKEKNGDNKNKTDVEENIRKRMNAISAKEEGIEEAVGNYVFSKSESLLVNSKKRKIVDQWADENKQPRFFSYLNYQSQKQGENQEDDNEVEVFEIDQEQNEENEVEIELEIEAPEIIPENMIPEVSEEVILDYSHEASTAEKSKADIADDLIEKLMDEESETESDDDTDKEDKKDDIELKHHDVPESKEIIINKIKDIKAIKGMVKHESVDLFASSEEEKTPTSENMKYFKDDLPKTRSIEKPSENNHQCEHENFVEVKVDMNKHIQLFDYGGHSYVITKFK